VAEALEPTYQQLILRLRASEEVLDYAKRFRLIVGDGVSEIVRIFGPEDFGTI